MAYYNTTINSATPARDLATWLGTKLTDNGWTVHDTWYPAATRTGTMSSGAVSSADSTTLTRSGGSNWTASDLSTNNCYVTIMTGTGATTTPVLITANTTTTLTVAAWANGTPDNTSTFQINSVSAKVYKSPAASNSIGMDFYVGIHRYWDTSTTLNISIFEDWDAVNKKARKYAPAAGTGITVNVTDNTVTDATGLLLDSATLMLAQPYCAVSTSYVHYLDVTVNRFLFGNLTQGAYTAQVGIFESLLPSSMDPKPLGIITPYSGSPSGASTREPGAPATSANNFRITVTGTSSGSTYKSYMYTYNQNASAQTVTTDVYLGVLAGRIWFTSQRGTTSSGRGVSDFYTSASGGVAGDTLTVSMRDGSTRTYILVTPYTTNYAASFIRTS